MKKREKPLVVMIDTLLKHRNSPCVKFLSLIMLTIYGAGCSFLQGQYGETCKSRAYVRIPIEEHINTQFNKNSMVRLGIVPLLTAANFAGYSDNSPPLGSQLAWRLHGEMLKHGGIPIVEVTSWHDWPIKREDFFTGNFESLRRARESGYDLVFVGFLEQSNPEEAAVLGKIIDVRAGLTLWYGRIYALSHRTQVNQFADSLSLARDHRLNRIDPTPLYNKLMECVAEESLSDDVATPEAENALFSWMSMFS